MYVIIPIQPLTVLGALRYALFFMLGPQPPVIILLSHWDLNTVSLDPLLFYHRLLNHEGGTEIIKFVGSSFRLP